MATRFNGFFGYNPPCPKLWAHPPFRCVGFPRRLPTVSNRRSALAKTRRAVASRGDARPSPPTPNPRHSPPSDDSGTSNDEPARASNGVQCSVRHHAQNDRAASSPPLHSPPLARACSYPLRGRRRRSFIGGSVWCVGSIPLSTRSGCWCRMVGSRFIERRRGEPSGTFRYGPPARPRSRRNLR